MDKHNAPTHRRRSSNSHSRRSWSRGQANTHPWGRTEWSKLSPTGSFPEFLGRMWREAEGEDTKMSNKCIGNKSAILWGWRAKQRRVRTLHCCHWNCRASKLGANIGLLCRPERQGPKAIVIACAFAPATKVFSQLLYSYRQQQVAEHRELLA